MREGDVLQSIEEDQITSSGSIYGGLISYQSNDKGIVLNIYNVGRIWLDDNGEITVERFPEVDPAEMRFYILGAALGMFLIRQGAFPLHGSTVSGKAGGVLFCGTSGAGKSTTTAWFMEHGYALVGDDISLIYFDADGSPRVWPGIPHVKLWDDSTRALQRDPENLPRLLDKWKKRRLPAGASALADSSPLTAVFYLHPEEVETPSIELLTGMERFAALAGNIYRGETILELGKSKDHFAFVTRLAACTPVFALSRPEGRFALKEIQELVEHTINHLHESGNPPR